MKKTSYANKMRWIAGGLYGLLAVYQMFLSKPILQQGTIASLPFTLLYNIALFLCAAAVCVWMFHAREALSSGARRAVVAVTFFFVVFELLTYSDQTEVINITLYSLFPSMMGNTVVLYTLMVLRLLLMIFAAFLAAGTVREKVPQPEDGGAAEDGGVKLEIVEVMEEVVLPEAEETPADIDKEMMLPDLPDLDESEPENAGEKEAENSNENKE